jgi:hypothetical protein
MIVRDQAWRDPLESEQVEGNRQTASLAGLALILFLLVVGMFLVHVLNATGRMEDCLLAGRHDCQPVDVTASL